MSQEDKEIGWRFPLTDGGKSSGFNNTGVAHFAGARISSLARETIQNSLDAKVQADEPVRVTFESVILKKSDFGGEELEDAVDSCIMVAGKDEAIMDDEKTIQGLADVKKFLNRKSIKCLRITDSNTTGLNDAHWRALVKQEGVSFKDGIQGVGGSHGIGKFAPFAVSKLRTVFYWTSYFDEGKSHEKLQGTSILMSHEDHDGEETQGTGYYGIKQRCTEIVSEIPREFRVFDNAGNLVQGTSITILGLDGKQNWISEVANSTIDNYFLAVERNLLVLTLKLPDGDFDLDREVLGQYFSESDNAGELDTAQLLWELSREDPTSETSFRQLGKCRLWVKTGVGYPSIVAMARSTGMVVTNKQQGLLKFSRCQDFIALFVFEDKKGNEFMRRMENPKHDQFEPEWMGNDEELGKAVLKEVIKWIRREIRGVAGPPQGGTITELKELAKYLPLEDEDDPFDEGDKEAGIGTKVTVRLKAIPEPPDPRPKPKPRPKPIPPDPPDQPPQPTPRPVEVHNVRMIPQDEGNNLYVLIFSHSGGDGSVILNLLEAGESTNDVREDIFIVKGEQSTPLHRTPVVVKSGERTRLVVTSDSPMADTAWILNCYQEGTQNRTEISSEH